ncbi:UNVERIFIED_CONTAM: RHS repeat-associated protein [Acetivibrio alkalicellulosi]
MTEWGVETESIRYGDLNGDGRVNSTDYVLIRRYILRIMENPSDERMIAADLNGDGRLDSTDAVILRRMLLEILKYCPADTNQDGFVNEKSNIKYAGYFYDGETGLYYLNARFYDPETARFIQEDTYRGSINDPLSLNLYAYGHNNPIKYYDPTGHWVELRENLEKLLKVQRKYESVYENPYMPWKSKQDYFDILGEEIDVIKENIFNTVHVHENWYNSRDVIVPLMSKSSHDILKSAEDTRFAMNFIEQNADANFRQNVLLNTGQVAGTAALIVPVIKGGVLAGVVKTGTGAVKTGAGAVKTGASAINAATLRAYVTFTTAAGTVTEKGKCVIKKGFSKLTGKGTGKLSSGKIEHVLKDHTSGRMENTINKMMEKGLTDQAKKLLDKKSFFNPSWSEQKVIDATNQAYNKALSQGITHGEYTVKVFGENITVYMENGVFRSAYGNFKLTLSNFGF